MKCSDVQQVVMESDLKKMPSEIEEHLSVCPECRKIHQNARALHTLLAFKNYEQPAPGAADRCVEGVKRLIQTQPAEAEPEPSGLWSFFQLPAFSYAAAMVFLLLAAFFFFLKPTADQTASQTDQREQLATSATNLAVDAPFQLPAGTNADPSQIQYGPHPSRLVDFKQ